MNIKQVEEHKHNKRKETNFHTDPINKKEENKAKKIPAFFLKIRKQKKESTSKPAKENISNAKVKESNEKLNRISNKNKSNINVENINNQINSNLNEETKGKSKLKNPIKGKEENKSLCIINNKNLIPNIIVAKNIDREDRKKQDYSFLNSERSNKYLIENIFSEDVRENNLHSITKNRNANFEHEDYHSISKNFTNKLINEVDRKNYFIFNEINSEENKITPKKNKIDLESTKNINNKTSNKFIGLNKKSGNNVDFNLKTKTLENNLDKEFISKDFFNSNSSNKLLLKNEDCKSNDKNKNFTSSKNNLHNQNTNKMFTAGFTKTANFDILENIKNNKNNNNSNFIYNKNTNIYSNNINNLTQPNTINKKNLKEDFLHAQEKCISKSKNTKSLENFKSQNANANANTNITKLNSIVAKQKFRNLILLKNICDSASENEFGLEEEVPNQTIFDLKSPFRYYWNVLNLFLILYFSTYGIFRLAFYPKDFENLGFYFETFSDVVFILDIVFTFFMPYMKKKRLIQSKADIAYAYIFKWFLVDVVSSLPINVFLLVKYISFLSTFRNYNLETLEEDYYSSNSLSVFSAAAEIANNSKSFGLQPGNKTLLKNEFLIYEGKISRMNIVFKHEFNFLDYYSFKIFQWLRLLKIIKVLLVDNFAEIANSKNQENTKNKAKPQKRKKAKSTKSFLLSAQEKEENVLSSYKTNGFLKLFFIFFTLTHISTCLWISVAQIGNPENTSSWTKSVNNFWQMNKFDIYIASLYFNLLTIYTVGYGDIVSKNNTERIFNIFLLTIGNLLFSLGISYLSFLFANFNELEDKMKERIKILDKINKKYDLPVLLYKEIKRNINTFYSKAHLEKFIIFDSLPLFLRSEMILSMHKKGISNFNFFKFSEKEFIIAVLPLLKNQTIEKNDILISVGGIVEEIYLVNNGVMSVCLDKVFDNVQISELKKNAHFGDVLIHLNEKSPYLIKCYTKSAEYLTLSKSDYNKISVVYNKIIMKILEMSCKFLENIEKNKQVVMDLFDEGIKLNEVKNLIRSINSCLINKNFFEFFYGRKSKHEKFNARKGSSNSDQKEKEIEDPIISTQDFIINQEIQDIVAYSKTALTEKDFDRIFILNKLTSDEKNLLAVKKEFSSNNKNSKNSESEKRNKNFSKQSVLHNPNFFLESALRGNKINRKKQPPSEIKNNQKRRNSFFKDQLQSINTKIKKFFTIEENVDAKKSGAAEARMLSSNKGKSGNEDEFGLFADTAADKMPNKNQVADFNNNFENLENEEKNIKKKLKWLFGKLPDDYIGVVENNNNSNSNSNVNVNLINNGNSNPINFGFADSKENSQAVSLSNDNKNLANNLSSYCNNFSDSGLIKYSGNKKVQVTSSKMLVNDVNFKRSEKENEKIERNIYNNSNYNHKEKADLLVLNENRKNKNDSVNRNCYKKNDCNNNNNFYKIKSDQNCIKFIKQENPIATKNNNNNKDNFYSPKNNEVKIIDKFFSTRKTTKNLMNNNILKYNLSSQNFAEDDQEIELKNISKHLKTIKTLEEERDDDPNENLNCKKDNYEIKKLNFEEAKDLIKDEFEFESTNKNYNSIKSENSFSSFNDLNDENLFEKSKKKFCKYSYTQAKGKTENYFFKTPNKHMEKTTKSKNFIDDDFNKTEKSNNERKAKHSKNTKKSVEKQLMRIHFPKIKKAKTFSRESSSFSSKETKYQNVNIYQIGSISNNNNFIFNNNSLNNNNINNKNKNNHKNNNQENSKIKIEKESINFNTQNLTNNFLLNELLNNSNHLNKLQSQIRKRDFENTELKVDHNISFEIVKGKVLIDYLDSDKNAKILFKYESNEPFLFLTPVNIDKERKLKNLKLNGNNNINRNSNNTNDDLDGVLRSARGLKNKQKENKEKLEKLKNDYFHINDNPQLNSQRRTSKNLKSLANLIEENEDQEITNKYKNNFKININTNNNRIYVKEKSNKFKSGEAINFVKNRTSNKSIINLFNNIAHENKIDSKNHYAEKLHLKNEFKNSLGNFNDKETFNNFVKGKIKHKKTDINEIGLQVSKRKSNRESKGNESNNNNINYNNNCKMRSRENLITIRIPSGKFFREEKDKEEYEYINNCNHQKINRRIDKLMKILFEKFEKKKD